MDDTRRLVLGARSGDKPALATLVDRYQARLIGFVRLNAGRDLRSREETVDLVQNILCEVVREYEDFDWRGEAEFRGWLYRKARQRLIDRARYHGSERRNAARELGLDCPRSPEELLTEAYSGLTNPLEIAARNEDIANLESAFVLLPEADREVLGRAFVLGLSTREVAEELGVSMEVARKRKTRALVRLAAAMRKGEQSG